MMVWAPPPPLKNPPEPLEKPERPTVPQLLRTPVELLLKAPDDRVVDWYDCLAELKLRLAES